MAFIFRDEKIYNPILQKKKNASKNFIDLFHKANAVLNQTNETIMEIILGVGNFSKMGTVGVMIATKKRLVFIDKDYAVKTWNYNDICDVTVATKAWTGYKFSFNTESENVEISSILEGDPDTFIAYIKSMKENQTNVMKQPKTINNKSEDTPSSAEDSDVIIAEIRKYAALKEEGILTDEEFTLKKKQLLGI
ncbi:PH domain-containing protein [Bacillus altitudinis]|uniref:PH domain-containing protein n=1 Tax=Bacillus altitudinis TaxID=293387 RepID=UPI00207969EB|nr:PH domain-containing protein [Bacillus altitudinis]USK25526.1 PH domain-containing protein [Bacillus altitudinis]